MLALALALLSAPVPASPSATVAFTIEATAVIRAAPKDDAVAVRAVPIWTAVRIDGVDNGWAHVVIGPRTLLYASLEAEPQPIAPAVFDPSWPAGFLRVGSLDATPESRLGLLTHAKASTDPARKRLLFLRAWSLDPGDDEVAFLAVGPNARAPMTHSKDRSPMRAADLVVGCRGDLARAHVVFAPLSAPAGVRDEADACAAHVDERPPCSGAEASAAHKQLLARFVPRFPDAGPALRLEPSSVDRPIYVVAHLLASDGCSDDCTPLASSSEVRVARLRVPAVSNEVKTTLHVLVPRYTGALYDVVAADGKEDVDSDPIRFEIGESFDVDPRDDPPAGAHLYMAPAACCASCNTDDER
ncbi:MAG TPA: hypothetical protein VGO62_08325 [Myxococcota bacterium]